MPETHTTCRTCGHETDGEMFCSETCQVKHLKSTIALPESAGLELPGHGPSGLPTDEEMVERRLGRWTVDLDGWHETRVCAMKPLIARSGARYWRILFEDVHFATTFNEEIARRAAWAIQLGTPVRVQIRSTTQYRCIDHLSPMGDTTTTGD